MSAHCGRTVTLRPYTECLSVCSRPLFICDCKLRTCVRLRGMRNTEHRYRLSANCCRVLTMTRHNTAAIWPKSQEFIQETFSILSEEQRQKIVHDTAARVYKIAD